MQGLYALAYDKPLWVIGATLLVAMLLARELGAIIKRRIKLRFGENLPDEHEEGHIVGAVLGLLALLIAFTFGLALDRFEARRELVVKESKALAAAYLRTDFVADPEPLRQELRVYATERVRYGHAPIEEAKVAEHTAKPFETKLWRQTMIAVEPIKTTAAAMLVSTPVNDAIDLALERRAINAARLPKAVLWALIWYAVVSAGILGYAIPGANHHHRLTSVVLFGLITLALTLVLDLDRPRSGSIMVPQAPMEEALESMAPPDSAAHAPVSKP